MLASPPRRTRCDNRPSRLPVPLVPLAAASAEAFLAASAEAFLAASAEAFLAASAEAFLAAANVALAAANEALAAAMALAAAKGFRRPGGLLAFAPLSTSSQRWVHVREPGLRAAREGLKRWVQGKGSSSRRMARDQPARRGASRVGTWREVG